MCGTSPATAERPRPPDAARGRAAGLGWSRLGARLIGLALVLVAGHARAAAGLPTTVAEALAALDIPPAAIAIYVKDPRQPAPLLAHQADLPMNPASVIKLVTTYAALEALGPAYRWKTDIYAAGPLRGDRLLGPLVFRGSGDPRITPETLWLWLKDLRARGIRDIRGDVVVDRSVFDLPHEDPGAFDGQPQRPYNVPPDALLINFRTWQLRFFPDERTRTVRVAPLPDMPRVRLVSEVRLLDGPCGNWKEGIGTDLLAAGRGMTLRVRGAYPASCGSQTLDRVLLAPDEQLAALFASLWREMGGRWQGKVVDGRVPEDARLLARHDSPPLAEVVRDINKFSNNVMARQLYLTLGAELMGAPATPEKAAQAVEAVLASRHLDFLELVMGNGSGLDRRTRVSARHLGQLLEAALASPWFAEFESSLPIAAIDGTMARRLRDAPLAGQARIKTGTLDGVRAIAGYVLGPQGRRRIVVCLLAHPEAARAAPVLDALLMWAHAQP